MASQPLVHGGGEMGQRIREFPWEATPVNAPAHWPPALLYNLRTVLQSGFPMLLLWGEDLTCFYNDAYRNVLGGQGKHPHILGMPAHKAWPEVWSHIHPLLQQVMKSGDTCTFEDLELPFYRDGKVDNVYWTFSYSPVYGDSEEVEGVLVVCSETTRKVTRFQSLLQQLRSPVIIYRGPDLIVEEANQAVLDSWKTDRSIIGKPLAQVLPELVQQGFVDLLQQVYHTGEPFTGHEVPAYFEREGGARELFYWNLEVSPYFEKNGTVSGIIAIATDVTEEVLAKQDLTIAEDEMRVALEAAGIGYWNLNPATNSLKCNKKTKELFGLPPDEAVDLSLALNQIHEADRQRVVARIKEALDYQSGGHYDITYQVVNAYNGNSSYVRAIGKTYFDEQHKPYRFSGTVQDITHHKKMEADLRRSEEKYRTLFENMEQGFCIVEVLFDAAGENTDLRFLEYNSRFTAQSGLTDAAGKTVSELLPGEAAEWIGRYAQVLKTGMPARFTNVAGAGGRWFDVLAFRFEAAPGATIAILFSDITERKTTDEKLREQQRFTESILEAAPSLTYIYDLSVDCNAFASTQVERILGYSVQEVKALGSSFLPSLMHPEDATATKEHLEKLLHDTDEEIYTVEYRMRHKDGHWVWLFDRTRVFCRDASRRPVQVLGVATDITERKQAEEDLKQQQQFTESIIEAAPSLTYVFDLIAQSNTFSSRQITSILGYSREEMIAMGDQLLSQLLHPADVPNTQSRFARIMEDAENEIHEVEYRMQHKNGTWVWLFDRARVFRRDAAGKPLQILGVATEITSRKTTEAALQESERRLRTMADTLPQLVWVSSPAGLVQWQNLRNKEFFGDYYIGDRWMQFLHPDDVERTSMVWGEAVRTGQAYEVEYRFFDRKTGTYRWFLVKALPLRDSDGSIVNWFGTCTDIHDQKMMTEKLEALVAERTHELQRSNEDLQQFAHVASHDLKEPVRKIRTFVSLFDEEIGNTIPAKGKAYLSKVRKSAERMSAMIDGVLQYSSLGAQQVLTEPVDLNKLVREVENDLELTMQQKAAQIHCSNLPVVPGSPVLLYQLLYNLVNNSLKFSRDGIPPQIRIYTSEVQNANAGKKLVQLVVEDNGIGFSNQDAELIFGTFIRLHSKDQYEGTGLGLALCKKIVERHGGNISASGTEGTGATFIISLPA